MACTIEAGRIPVIKRSRYGGCRYNEEDSGYMNHGVKKYACRRVKRKMEPTWARQITKEVLKKGQDETKKRQSSKEAKVGKVDAHSALFYSSLTRGTGLGKCIIRQLHH